MRGHEQQTNDVIRRRLLDRLAGRFERRVTLIEAGPGFGKTTLLRQAVAEFAGCTDALDAPISVPRSGMTSTKLAAALTEALHAASPKASGAPAASVPAGVWAASPAQVCIVIDDAHWLDLDAFATVVALESELPANGHLLVSLRPDSALPLSRLSLVGHTLVLGNDDLAFDDVERHAFESLRNAGPSPERSSGWPALLELELRTGRTGALRYVIEEVVSMLGEEGRDVCRRLGVLPSVDDAIATAILGRPTSAELVLGHLPLTRVIDGRVEIHDLLRDAFHAGWPAEARAEAFAAAGNAALSLNDLDLALELAGEASDNAGAVRIARRLAGELHFASSSQRRTETTARLRRILGDAVEVNVVEAVNAALEEPGRAPAQLEAALARTIDVADSELEALCRLCLAEVAYNAADIDSLTSHADALDQLADADVAGAVRTAFLPHIWIMSLTNRAAEVVTHLDEVRGRLTPGSDPDVEQVIAMYRIWYLGYSGHIRAALEQLAMEPPASSGLFANRTAGFVLLQRWFLGQLTADERRSVADLVDRIGTSGQVHLFVEGAASVSLFHASAGDVGVAEDFLRRAEAAAHRLAPTAWAHHTVAQARAALLVLAGDEDAARVHLADAIPDGGITAIPRHIYSATATLSYLLVPSAREVWEADSCGPDHVLRRDIGRALVALREHDDLRPAAALPWDDVARLRTWAFEPHLAELALGAIDGGNPDAEAALDTLVYDPKRVVSTLATNGPLAVRLTATTLAATRPVRPHESVTIGVLGPIELRRNGVLVDDASWVRRQRVRDLVAVLVDRRTIDRSELAEMMWPDKALDAAMGNLRFTLSQLVGVFEPNREPSRPSWFIRSVGNSLVLDGRELLSVDLDLFDQHLAHAASAERHGEPAVALDAYLAAVELYRGDYLSGVSDREWGYYESLRLRGRFITAAVRAVDMLLAIGDLPRAEALAVRAARAEPIHETAQCALAEVLVAQQRPGAARELIAELLAQLRRAGMSADHRTIRLAVRFGVDFV